MPNAESALNEEAGKMLLERYDDYSTRAKMLTQIHAQPKSTSTSPTSCTTTTDAAPELASAPLPTQDDDGPLSKKSTVEKKPQDKKKEKIVKEKKRVLKRLWAT